MPRSHVAERSNRVVWPLVILESTHKRHQYVVVSKSESTVDDLGAQPATVSLPTDVSAC